MLKRAVLFLFCTLIYVSHVKSTDYVNYFRAINRAELRISKSDYRTALSIYKDVFKRFPHSFEKEIYNAVLCAIKENQWKDVLQFSKKLTLHGYELKDFESPAFNKFRNNKKYWEQFLSEYPEMREKYEKTVDQELRNKYLTLYKTDQQFASHSVDIKTQDSVFYELVLSVSNLIKEYGFSHWFTNKDTINFKIQTMLRHYCGLENRIKADEKMQKDSLYIRMQNNNIRLLATQALHEGWLDPDRYVSVVSEWDGINPYGEIAIGIDFETEKVSLFLRVPPEKRDEMNEKRDSIGLPVIGESTRIKSTQYKEYPFKKIKIDNEPFQDVINSTWYREYPFKKIKEAWLTCDTCLNMVDYVKIGAVLGLEISNQYEDKENYFRYYSKRLSNNIYFFNTEKYQKNIKRRHDTDNQ